MKRTAEQVVQEWRDSGSTDWGQLVSAINYWAMTDMCPELNGKALNKIETELERLPDIHLAITEMWADLKGTASERESGGGGEHRSAARVAWASFELPRDGN
jgi:hypothetical protein